MICSIKLTSTLKCLKSQKDKKDIIKIHDLLLKNSRLFSLKKKEQKQVVHFHGDWFAKINKH